MAAFEALHNIPGIKSIPNSRFIHLLHLNIDYKLIHFQSTDRKIVARSKLQISHWTAPTVLMNLYTLWGRKRLHKRFRKLSYQFASWRTRSIGISAGWSRHAKSPIFKPEKCSLVYSRKSHVLTVTWLAFSCVVSFYKIQKSEWSVWRHSRNRVTWLSRNESFNCI